MAFKKPFLIVFTGCFILIGTINAQFQVKGTVRDPQNKIINNISIQINLLSDTLQKKGVNSEDGDFEFRDIASGTYVLKVTRTGYQENKVYLNLTKDTSLIINLAPFVTDLDEVTVTGRKKLIEKKVDRTIFNVSSSVTAQGGNVLSAITKIPGVKIAGNEVSIVGKGSVKVMINGKIVNISDETLTQYLAGYSANHIEKIEVITSPPANYDAAGNAGLINIVTKESQLEGWSGTVQGSYKNVNTYSNTGLTADINYQKNKWTIYTNFTGSRSGELMGWIIGVDYPDRNWSLNDTGIYNIDQYNGTIGIDYAVGKKSSIGISYSGGYREENGNDDVKNYITGHPSGKIDSTIRSYAVYNPIAISNSFNLHYLNKFNEKGAQLSIDGDYFNFYRTDYSNFKGWTQIPGMQEPKGDLMLYYNTAKQNILIYTLKADLTLPTSFASWMFGSKLSFITNNSNALYYDLQSGSKVYDSSKSNIYGYVENTQAFYATGTKNMNKWTIQAGLRAEITKTNGHSYTLNQIHKDHYLKFYPSVAISVEANEQNSFTGTFSKRINRPSFWTLNPYRSLLTSFAYYDGNPALKPEYTSQLELGHNYKKLFSTSVYVNRTNNGFDNLTIGSMDTNLVYRTPLNFLTTTKYGMTEIISFSPLSWWESTNQFNLYYTDAKSNLFIVKDLAGWGKYIATSNNFYFNKDKTFSGAINYWCQFPEIDHIGRSNTYSSLDLGLMYTTLNKKWNFALNATDIFKNSAPTIYTTVNGLQQSFDNFQLSRSIVFGLTYKFGSNRKSDNRKSGNEEEKSRL